jgi:hypothetical protein
MITFFNNIAFGEYNIKEEDVIRLPKLPMPMNL